MEATPVSDVLKNLDVSTLNQQGPRLLSKSDAHWYQDDDPMRKLKADELWRKTYVPRLHASAKLRSEPGWIKVLEHCRATVTRVEKRGAIMALIGNRGTGKTQIAVEALRHACLALYTCKYTRAFDIFLSVRAAMKSQATSEADAMRELLQAEVLVIDEMQERGETPFEDRLLVNLLDRRYGNMTDTILIANQTPEEFTAALGPSITDRIRETGGLIECTWESFRA